MSYKLMHLDSDKPDPMFETVSPEVPSVPLPTIASGTDMSYELESPDGSKEVISTQNPFGQGEEPRDPMALARLRLNQLRTVRRMIGLKKRAAKNAEKSRRKLEKRRTKRTAEKASRHANRAK